MLRKDFAILGAAGLLVAVTAGSASAFTPQPGPIFNNPAGDPDARTRIRGSTSPTRSSAWPGPAATYGSS